MEKGKKVSKRFTCYYSIEARQLLVKELGLFFNMGRDITEMQLIYFIAIFQDDYNIACDRFETDSLNVMKNRLLVAKKQGKFQ